MTPRARPPERPVPPWRRHIGWLAVGLVALLGLIGGAGGALVCGGAAAAAYGLLRLVRGRSPGYARRPAVVTTALGVAVALVGGASLSSAPPPAAVPPSVTVPGSTATPAPTGAAVAALAQLVVKGRAPKTGYRRDRFGTGWASSEGCDTRDRILRRDLTAVTVQRGTGGCLVLSGSLVSPYTGRPVAMVRGADDQVEIDHVVALSDAWQKGAQRWRASERVAFANDPLNLLAVDGLSNATKSDGDAATWLPAAKAYRCRYVARQISVKRDYGLWVTAAEGDAMLRILRACPTQPLVTADAARADRSRHVSVVAPRREPRRTPGPDPSSSPTGPGGGSGQRFGTCKEANAAGLGPYVRGRDAEYAWYRDADGDGTVCER